MLIHLIANNAVSRSIHLNGCIACLTCGNQFRLPKSITESPLPSRRVHNKPHNVKPQDALGAQNRKVIPKLVYLHNPWKYLVTKVNMWKLKWLWDHGFSEAEFIEGSKQAAIVMTDIIRQQSTDKISEFTTPVGFQQITRDMLLSRNDSRLQLVRFEKEHLRRAIPMKVATRQNYGRKYAFIDMLFVGLRNTKDFSVASELLEVKEILRRMDNELRTPVDTVAAPHRIVFAEIFIRFRRDYTAEWRRKQAGGHAVADMKPSISPSLKGSKKSHNHLMGQILSRLNDPGWSVSFYKILTFDVLNFDPQPNRQSKA